MLVGETVSHYRIVGLLGAEGMGEVYKAEDTRRERHVGLVGSVPGVDAVAQAPRARFSSSFTRLGFAFPPAAFIT